MTPKPAWWLWVVGAALLSWLSSRLGRAKERVSTLGLAGDSYGVGLSAHLANFVEPSTLIGQSAVGATTAEVLSWVPSLIAQGATMVLISAGANDWTGGTAAMVRARARAAELEQSVRGSPVRLVWLTNPVTPAADIAPERARSIDPPDGMQLVDGVHPSPAGYRTWAEKIVKEL